MRISVDKGEDVKGPRLAAIAYLLKFALKLAAAGALLLLVGGMSLRACIAIVILLALVGSWSWQKPSNNFTLYEVKIVPRIGLMLIALGLVTKDDWERLNQNRLAPAPWTSFHLRNGITAVVLSDHPRESSAKTLVHWTSHNAQTGRDFCLPSYRRDRIECSVSLDFLKFKDLNYPEHESFDWSPEFFFEQGMDGSKVGGYEIGIEVAASWWSGNKQRLENEGIAKFLKVHDAPGHLRTRIALAVLPRDVFLLFDARDWDKEFAQNLREQVKKELALARWRIEAIGFADNIENEFVSMCKLGESYSGDFADVTVKSLVC
jgi:hypothetical protein